MAAINQNLKDLLAGWAPTCALLDCSVPPARRRAAARFFLTRVPPTLRSSRIGARSPLEWPLERPLERPCNLS